jgi:hypothetical protein
MKKGKLELKIIKDTDGSEISLDSMSLAASKAFIVFIQSLTQIAEQITDKKDVKIIVTKGSASVALEAVEEEIENIECKYNDVIKYSSSNSDFIDPMRAIQSVICANGLQYEANIIKESIGSKRAIIDGFKQRRKFFSKTTRTKKQEFKIEFLSGKLLEIGGKKPNIHIVCGKDTICVACTEEEAWKVNQFIYKEIYLSVKAQYKNGVRTKIEFCDFYANEDDFNELKYLYEKCINDNGLERFDFIYDYVVGKLTKELKDAGYLNKLMRLFQYDFSDRGVLRTILTAIKPKIKTDKGLIIKDMYQKLASTLSESINN